LIGGIASVVQQKMLVIASGAHSPLRRRLEKLFWAHDDAAFLAHVGHIGIG
jgi:DNA polymerase IIIc chi subunit